jgi:hypothetical protein
MALLFTVCDCASRTGPLGRIAGRPEVLETAAARGILHGMFVCLLVRILINNHGEVIAAYRLTVQRRAGVRRKEQDFSTHDPAIDPEGEFSDEALNPKVHIKRRNSYDDAIIRLAEIIGNAASLIADSESTASAFGGHFEA